LGGEPGSDDESRHADDPKEKTISGQLDMLGGLWHNDAPDHDKERQWQNAVLAALPMTTHECPLAL
jgi:hypothetical protein